MKRFLSVFLPLVLLLMTLASCQRVDPSDYPDATNPPSEQEQQIAALQSAMEFSDPFSADSTVTMTISEDLKLVSTFKVNKDGNCVYNIQRLKPYEQGSTDTNMIETFKGTKKASASPEDGVFVSQLTFDLAYFTDYTMAGRTYRYIEEEPLYPFGYGLTYGDCRVASARRIEGGAQVEIVNEGVRDTDEVVQIYVQNMGSANAPRNPRLCGFSRVALAAGEEKRVTIAIPREALKVVNADGERIFEGRPVLYAGVSQPDSRSRALTGHACIEIELA